MKWFYLTIMPLLSAFKVTSQGYFSKGKLNSTADMLKFTGYMSLFSALSLIIFTVRALPSFETVIYAFILAISSVSYQSLYSKAFTLGPISLSSTIVSFSIVISIIFSIIAYDEPVTIFKIIGFILMIFALLLTPAKKSSNTKTSFKWLLFCFLTVLATGIFNIVQIIFSHSDFSSEKSSLIAMSYIFASVFCFIIIPFVKGNQPLYKTDKKLAIFLPLMGLSLGLYYLFNLSALELFPASEFLPSLSALCLLCTILISCILLKERLTIKQIFGVISTILSVVFLNL